MTRAFAVAAALVAGPAMAEAPILVSNPEMCGQPDDAYLGELGMQLTTSSMEEIEYYCEFDPPITFDWSEDRVLSRVGCCNEPDLILPTVFAFQMGPSEPGVVWLWEQGSETPTRFTACP